MEVPRFDRIDALAMRFGQGLATLENKLVGRLQVLEQENQMLRAEIESLRPLRDADRFRLAQTCQKLGVPLETVTRKFPSRARAQSVARVFKELRTNQQWPFTRIARAAGYSDRGVRDNLRFFGA